MTTSLRVNFAICFSIYANIMSTGSLLKDWTRIKTTKLVSKNLSKG